MALTEILKVLQDIFLNFCVRISNAQPSLIRIHLQIEIYGMFSFCQIEITFDSLFPITLYKPFLSYMSLPDTLQGKKPQ